MKKISRRTFNLAALTTLLVGPSACATMAAGELPKTPAQGEGPFYPPDMKPGIGNNLVRMPGAQDQAQGEYLRLGGRVVDAQGRAQRGMRVEIWQVDHQGIYNHPNDANFGRRDQYFRGFGDSVTDADGRYEFLTLVPAVYPGRPPHIHVKIKAESNAILTTQLYLKDHPLNRKDGMFMWLFGLGSTRYLQIQPIAAGMDGDRPLKQADFDFVI